VSKVTGKNGRSDTLLENNRNRGHQTHMPRRPKQTTLAFGSLKIQDKVMADANQINEHVAQK